MKKFITVTLLIVCAYLTGCTVHSGTADGGKVTDTAEGDTSDDAVLTSFTLDMSADSDDSVQTDAETTSQESEIMCDSTASISDDTTGEAVTSSPMPDVTSSITEFTETSETDCDESTEAIVEETTGVPDDSESLPFAPETEVSESTSEISVTTEHDMSTTDTVSVTEESIADTSDEAESLITSDSTADTEELNSPEETSSSPGGEEQYVSYRELSEALAGDAVAKAVSEINAHPFEGSVISYPFEVRNNASLLTDKQKAYYDELYTALCAFEPYVFAPGYGGNFNDFIAAYKALYRDYPELSFYSRTSEVTQYSRVVAIEIVYFLPSEAERVITGDFAELKHELCLMDSVCDYIIEKMPQNFSTYDKYRYLAAVVSYLTEYDYDYENGIVSENAYGAIINGTAVCRGYGGAFEYLCEKANLYCAFVQGSNMAMEVHMWNLVKLESGTYHVDVTWSDTTYGETLGSGWMRYFMLTQADTVKNHIIDDGTVATGTRLY